MQERDIKFIENPSEWPFKGKRLSMVKRYSKEVGILTDNNGVVEPVIVSVNLLGAINYRTKYLRYKSIAHILADGWRIDR